MNNRSVRIGGSDIPTLLGINPFKDLYTLLLEKCKLKEVIFEDSDYMEYGKQIEPLIRDYLNESTFNNDPLSPQDLWENDLGFVSRTDGKNSSTIVEIKSTSVIHGTVEDYMNYLVQLLFYIWRHYIKEGKIYQGYLVVYHRPDNFREQLKNNHVVFEKERLQLFPVNFNSFDYVLRDIKTAIDNFDYYVSELDNDPFLTEFELFGTITDFK